MLASLLGTCLWLCVGVVLSFPQYELDGVNTTASQKQLEPRLSHLATDFDFFPDSEDALFFNYDGTLHLKRDNNISEWMSLASLGYDVDTQYIFALGWSLKIHHSDPYFLLVYARTVTPEDREKWPTYNTSIGFEMPLYGVSVATRFSYTIGENGPVADLTSGVVILEIPRYYPAVGVFSGIEFGPRDGYLYLGTYAAPEGFTTFEVDEAFETAWWAQDLTRWEGKILRLDVSASTPSSPYQIPAGNPFIQSPSGLALGEIYASGFRNPYALVFAPDDKTLYAADHGMFGPDELNVIHAGANYGWPAFQGNNCTNFTDGFILSGNECCLTYPCATYTYPWDAYPHEIRGDSQALVGMEFAASGQLVLSGLFFSQIAYTELDHLYGPLNVINATLPPSQWIVRFRSNRATGDYYTLAQGLPPFFPTDPEAYFSDMWKLNTDFPPASSSACLTPSLLVFAIVVLCQLFG